MENCLFCKIVRGEIPSRKVYEDDRVVAFHDINPLRPVHLLIVPKCLIGSLESVSADDEPVLGRLLAVAGRLAEENGSPDGFRVILNNGRIGGQEVPHLHAHLLGGPEPVAPMLKRN